MTTCALCGRTGTRAFTLRWGNGDAPQTGDWQCANRAACRKRMQREHRKIVVDGVLGCSCGTGSWLDNMAGQHAFNEHKANAR